MFFSQSLLALLGLKSVPTAQILPLVNFPPVFDRVPEEIQMAENHRDSLARMEEDPFCTETIDKCPDMI